MRERSAAAFVCLGLLAVGLLGTGSDGWAQVSAAKLDLGAAGTTATVGTSSSVEDDAVLPAGIALPRVGTVHAIDQGANGPMLVQLHATEIVTNTHAVGNFLRGQVLAGYHGSVDLKEPNAGVHLQTTTPSFLVRLNGDDPELIRGRIHLLRLQQTESRRVVMVYSGNSFGGQHRKKMDEVAVSKVDVDPDVWVRVTPVEPLPAGEYGIVVMPKDVNQGPDAVYDFDVLFETAKPVQ